jgi:hypothetical protein
MSETHGVIVVAPPYIIYEQLSVEQESWLSYQPGDTPFPLVPGIAFCVPATCRIHIGSHANYYDLQLVPNAEAVDNWLWPTNGTSSISSDWRSPSLHLDISVPPTAPEYQLHEHENEDGLEDDSPASTVIMESPDDPTSHTPLSSVPHAQNHNHLHAALSVSSSHQPQSLGQGALEKKAGSLPAPATPQSTVSSLFSASPTTASRAAAALELGATPSDYQPGPGSHSKLPVRASSTTTSSVFKTPSTSKTVRGAGLKPPLTPTVSHPERDLSVPLIHLSAEDGKEDGKDDGKEEEQSHTVVGLARRRSKQPKQEQEHEEKEKEKAKSKPKPTPNQSKRTQRSAVSQDAPDATEEDQAEAETETETETEAVVRVVVDRKRKASSISIASTEAATKKLKAPPKESKQKSSKKVSIEAASTSESPRRVRRHDQQWCFCLGGMSDKLQSSLARQIEELGGSLAGDNGSVFSPAVTYYVTNEVRRTEKFLGAVLRGVPIVKGAFISACAKESAFMSPGPAHLWETCSIKHPDIWNGCIARARTAFHQQHGLFAGWHVLFVGEEGEFTPPLSICQAVLTHGGGIFTVKSSVAAVKGKVWSEATLIIMPDKSRSDGEIKTCLQQCSKGGVPLVTGTYLLDYITHQKSPDPLRYRPKCK